MNQYRFNGPVYDPKFDQARLSNQHEIIKTLMLDGKWRTLQEIEAITRYPHASISAQLRHLRKERFGSYTVNRRPRNDRYRGLYEYQLIKTDEQPAPALVKKQKCIFCGR